MVINKENWRITDDAQGLYLQFGFSEYEKSCMCSF